MSFKATLRAREAARELLNKYTRHEREAVDIEKIAEDLGIQIIQGEFTDEGNRNISGLIKISGKDGSPVIALKSTESETRKRFTIAHEIGHYVLHRDELLHVDSNLESFAFRDARSSMAVSMKEIQANQFAAELLMPTQEIQSLVKESVDKEIEATKIIQDIAETYQVSELAATIKISTLLNSGIA
jgi:Zn-dependent peptidase ImmA (M78 family)